jgi:DNA-binding NarL/FixJ family response regulator
MQVLIADHNPDVRTAMRLLLAEKLQVDNVFEVSDLTSLNNSLLKVQPEIILLDWELPGLSEENNLTAIREKAPDSRFVVISSQPEAKKIAIDLGLYAFIGKYQDPDAILKVLNKCQEEIVKLADE